MKRLGGFLIAGTLLSVLFVLFNLLAAWLGGGRPIDATADNRYTLSARSQAVLGSLKQPVTLRFYVSDDLSAYDWNLGIYAAETAALLSRYQLSAPEKVRLEIRRVKTSSEMEKQALQDGILPLNGSDKDYYFGLQIRDSAGKNAVIPALRPERRNILEKDINRILSGFEGNKAVVGWVSPQMPLLNGDRIPALQALLEEYYQVTEISAASSYIPGRVDVLLIVNPGQMPPVFGYAVDQYVMRGGKVVFFVDPYSEIRHAHFGYPPHPDRQMESFLRQWGIVYRSESIVGDLMRGEKVKDAYGRGRVYPLWFFTGESNGNNLHFRTPGSLETTENADLKYEVLASTGRQGGEIAVSEVRYTPKSQVILAYRQDNRARMLALLVQGQFRSHYLSNPLAATSSADKAAPYIPFSDPAAAVAVVADSDFVDDAAWVADFQPDNPVYGTLSYAGNADFLLRLIDRLAGEKSFVEETKPRMPANIAETLYAESYRRFAEQREQLETAEADAGARLEKLRKRGGDSENVSYRKEMEQAEREQRQNALKLQQLTRLTATDADRGLYRFVWLNLIVFPAVLIALLAAMVYAIRRWKRCRLSEKKK